MKLTLVIITSIDGRTFVEENANHHVAWASKEDQDFFFNEIIDKATLIIMGSRTYESSTPLIKHRQGRKRVVLTRTPEKYNDSAIPNLLEFTSEKPTDLINRLTSEGYTEGYHVGGAQSATAFFEEKLITNIFQTIEPKLFGERTGIVVNKFDISLTLDSFEKLNSQGTLLLKYSVLKAL